MTQAGMLAALGADQRLIRVLLAEVMRWRPYGALEWDDLWAIVLSTTWEVLREYPQAPAVYVRRRVRWHLARAMNRERGAKGWRRPVGGGWEAPQPRMRVPEWDWGRPSRRRAA